MWKTSRRTKIFKPKKQKNNKKNPLLTFTRKLETFLFMFLFPHPQIIKGMYHYSIRQGDVLYKQQPLIQVTSLFIVSLSCLIPRTSVFTLSSFLLYLPHLLSSHEGKLTWVLDTVLVCRDCTDYPHSKIVQKSQYNNFQTAISM